MQSATNKLYFPYAKMNGLGNEIIVCEANFDNDITPDFIIKIAEDKFSFDQLMVILPSVDDNSDYRLEIWNNDGSRASACGNGTRCVIDYLFEKTGKHKYKLAVNGKLLEASYVSRDEIIVDMGEPSFEAIDIGLKYEPSLKQLANFGYKDLINPTLVSMGNPHVIFFMEQDIYQFPLENYAPIIQKDPLFLYGCNVSIVQIIDAKSIKIRTYERGAGLTKACGTGACASAVAAMKNNLIERDVLVHLEGGDLKIRWLPNNHILMSGAVVLEEIGFLSRDIT